jgi:hypothetical protein
VTLPSVKINFTERSVSHDKEKIELTLYTILQILSISLFEKKLIFQVLTETNYRNKNNGSHIQLKLYES